MQLFGSLLQFVYGLHSSTKHNSINQILKKKKIQGSRNYQASASPTLYIILSFFLFQECLIKNYQGGESDNSTQWFPYEIKGLKTLGLGSICFDTDTSNETMEM